MRRHALAFAHWLTKLLAKILSGGKLSRDYVETGAATWESLRVGLKLRVDPPSQTPKSLQHNLKGTVNRWASDLENFVGQITDYARDRSEHLGNLAVLNFHNSRRHLMEVHAAFDKLFAVAPDYFSAVGINRMELEGYALLEDHLYAWIVDPPVSTERDIAAYARRRRRERVQANLHRAKQGFIPLIEAGATVIIPDDIYEEDSLTHLPIVVSVENPVHPEQALLNSVEALNGAREVADFVYVIPLYNGNRLIEGAYRFAPQRTDEILSRGLEVWDYLAALGLPEPVQALLPDLPYFPRPKLQIIGNVNVLLGQLYPLALVKEHASQLRLSSNRFDLAQSERLAAHVQKLCDEAKTLAKDTAELIMSEFPEARQDVSLKPSIQFLDAVTAARDQDDLVELHKSAKSDEKFIVSSLVDRVETTG